MQDQLQRGEQSAVPPRGMGLMAGLPAKGDSAFAKAARAPVKLGGCQPQLPSAGVSAFASYPVRSESKGDPKHDPENDLNHNPDLKPDPNLKPTKLTKPHPCPLISPSP